MSVSVADRVKHRLPRPVKCDHCGSPSVKLQKRSFMGLRHYDKWDLIWHCDDCGALVGCHEGTDIPLGLMADSFTRAARHEAHRAFDPLWLGKRAKLSRAKAYSWMADTLGIPPEQAHIGMLNMRQCEALIEAVRSYNPERKRPFVHWKQKERKKRRK